MVFFWGVSLDYICLAFG